MKETAQSEAKNSPSLTKIWRLIHVLSSKQKQDFKKSAAFHGKQKDELAYILLFDLVNECLDAAQKKWNNQVIEHGLQATKSKNSQLELQPNQIGSIFYQIFWQKFLKQEKISASDLGRVCVYLYARILESVRYQNEQKSLMHDLLSMLKDIQFLSEKELISECKELIFKAKEKADELGLYELQTYLFRVERNISLKTQPENEPAIFIEHLRLTEKMELDILQKLKEITELRAVNQESLAAIWTQKNIDEDAQFAGVVENFSNHFQQEPQHLSHDGKILWHHTVANLTVLARWHPSEKYQFLEAIDIEKTHFHLCQIVKIIMAATDFHTEFPSRTLSNVANCVLLTTFLNKQEPEIFDFFEKISTRKMNSVSFLRLVAYPKLNLFLIDKNQFENATNWIEEKRIWNLLKTYQGEIPPPNLQSILFLGGLSYAAKNRWIEAEKWFLENENSQLGMKNAASLVSSAYFLLLTHFEMKQFVNHIYPENVLHIFQNRLIKIKGKLDDFDKFFIRIFKQILPHPPDSKEVKNLLAEHFFDFERHAGEVGKPKSFHSIFAWMEAKMKNLDLSETVLKRLKQQGFEKK